MKAIAGPLLLVGSGKMGTALLTGWLDRGLSRGDVLVVEPANDGRAAVAAMGVQAVAAPESITRDKIGGIQPFRAVIFAVKPQMMADVLPAYATMIEDDTLVISIAAGTSISRFTDAFGEYVSVIRAMPNTPAAIGQGATALVASPSASAEQRDLAQNLMAAVGEVHWLEDEEQMHAVTAMSGGGPAYVFLLIETLAKAGMAAGLPEALAWPMARATVTGSGALAAGSAEPAATLRRNVTSPGGTTEAALKVLMADDGLQPLFDRALEAASARSRDLA